jgi:hypothetical protein
VSTSGRVWQGTRDHRTAREGVGCGHPDSGPASLLERLAEKPEDRLDAEDALRVNADERDESVPWEQVKGELGLAVPRGGKAKRSGTSHGCRRAFARTSRMVSSSATTAPWVGATTSAWASTEKSGRNPARLLDLGAGLPGRRSSSTTRGRRDDAVDGDEVIEHLRRSPADLPSDLGPRCPDEQERSHQEVHADRGVSRLHLGDSRLARTE